MQKTKAFIADCHYRLHGERAYHGQRRNLCKPEQIRLVALAAEMRNTLAQIVLEHDANNADWESAGISRARRILDSGGAK